MCYLSNPPHQWLLIRSRGWENVPEWQCLFVGWFLLDFLIIIHYSTHSTLQGKLYIFVYSVYCYVVLLGSCRNRIEFFRSPKGGEDTYLPGNSDKLGAIWGQELINSLKQAAYSLLGCAILGGTEHARFWVAMVTLPQSPDPYPFFILRSIHLPCFSCLLLSAEEETKAFLSTELGLRNPTMNWTSFWISHDSNESSVEPLDVHVLQNHRSGTSASVLL